MPTSDHFYRFFIDISSKLDTFYRGFYSRFEVISYFGLQITDANIPLCTEIFSDIVPHRFDTRGIIGTIFIEYDIREKCEKLIFGSWLRRINCKVSEIRRDTKYSPKGFLRRVDRPTRYGISEDHGLLIIRYFLIEVTVDHRILKGHRKKEEGIENTDIPYNPDTIKSSKVMIDKGDDMLYGVFHGDYFRMVVSRACRKYERVMSDGLDDMIVIAWAPLCSRLWRISRFCIFIG